MTEPNDAGRIDLTPLAPDSADEERVVGAVMARLTSRPQLAAAPAPDVLEIVGRHVPTRWIAAAAAVVITVSGTLVATNRDQVPSVEATIAAWAVQQHVPTNAELLLTFQGYGQ